MTFIFRVPLENYMPNYDIISKWEETVIIPAHALQAHESLMPFLGFTTKPPGQ